VININYKKFIIIYIITYSFAFLVNISFLYLILKS